mmetsp:Transcript_102253/g.294383  ORF Transcript_102253/g.294383 Transcript_102253/m.294383 type:complete len:299 (-) Transcript_102253:615-1511(-)
MLLNADSGDFPQGVPERARQIVRVLDTQAFDVMEDPLGAGARWARAWRDVRQLRRLGVRLRRDHLGINLRPMLDLAYAHNKLRPQALHVDDDELHAECRERQLEHRGRRLEFAALARRARRGLEALPVAVRHELGQAPSLHRLAEESVEVWARVDDAQVLAQLWDDIAAHPRDRLHALRHALDLRGFPLRPPLRPAVHLVAPGADVREDASPTKVEESPERICRHAAAHHDDVGGVAHEAECGYDPRSVRAQRHGLASDADEERHDEDAEELHRDNVGVFGKDIRNVPAVHAAHRGLA